MLILLFVIFHDFVHSVNFYSNIRRFLIVHLFVKQSLIRTLQCRFLFLGLLPEIVGKGQDMVSGRVCGATAHLSKCGSSLSPQRLTPQCNHGPSSYQLLLCSLHKSFQPLSQEKLFMPRGVPPILLFTSFSHDLSQHINIISMWRGLISQRKGEWCLHRIQSQQMLYQHLLACLILMVPRKKSLCSLLLTTMLLVILSLSPEFTVLTHSISTNITNIIFKSSDRIPFVYISRC